MSMTTIAPLFNDVAATLGDNAYGSFTLTAGTWTYTLDQSAVQNLDAGDVSSTIRSRTPRRMEAVNR